MFFRPWSRFMPPLRGSGCHFRGLSYATDMPALRASGIRGAEGRRQKAAGSKVIGVGSGEGRLRFRLRFRFRLRLRLRLRAPGSAVGHSRARPRARAPFDGLRTGVLVLGTIHPPQPQSTIHCDTTRPDTTGLPTAFPPVLKPSFAYWLRCRLTWLRKACRYYYNDLYFPFTAPPCRITEWEEQWPIQRSMPNNLSGVTWEP